MDENTRAKAPNVVEEIACQVGGTITEVGGPLPDGSGFAIMSMPLPKDHWIYGGDRQESYGVFNTPPMPFRMGSLETVVISRFPNMEIPLDPTKTMRLTKEEFASKIKEAGRYAVRCATMNGKEMDFDPDALIQNLQVGMLGYWTADGLSSDEWANPSKEGV